MAKKNGLLVLSFVVLAACDSKLSVEKFSQLVVTSLSCENFESKMFDSLIEATDSDLELPSPEDLRIQLDSDFKNIENYEQKKVIIDEIIQKFILMYNDIYLNHPVSFDKAAILEIKKYLMAIETRDNTVFNDINFISKYKNQLDELQETSKKLKQECAESELPEEPVLSKGSLLEHIKLNYPLEVYGAYKTFASAYQNCEAAQKPALTNTSKPLVGVKVVGRHPSGGGNLREISSLRDVQATHPYITERNSSTSGCFNTYQNPLIYDYGGKPKTINTLDSEINFFENDGTGTKALGTDCSGFVFSSVVTGGLKLNPDVTVKARQILSYGAARFVDPNKGGVSCFSKLEISPTTEITEGDIVASSGHIFLITKVGPDPLGTEKINRPADCNKIDESDFDFELMQSSPSLGAIGINKMKASEYLQNSSTMKEHLVDFSRKLCQSKFDSKKYSQTSTRASVIRHKKTTECKMNYEIKLSRQSCIQDCKMN